MKPIFKMLMLASLLLDTSFDGYLSLNDQIIVKQNKEPASFANIIVLKINFVAF